ncbi:MAG: hypothetical protein N2445_07605, partial [Acidobacteria bacterium]|nr:hypothetical protein [Acidobacteriota bacterium]
MRKQKHMFVVFVALALLLCSAILAGEPRTGQKLKAVDSTGREIGPSNYDSPVIRPTKQLWEMDVPYTVSYTHLTLP